MAFNPSEITIGRRRTLTMSLLDALRVVIGFAFGVEQTDADYGGDNPYLYGYRSWDCALRDHAPGLSEADVFASCGLNSGIDTSTILRLLALIDNNSTLPDLGANPDFWRLDPGRLMTDPGPGYPEHHLWVHYRAFTKLAEVAGAVSSKVIAHRWPSNYPLFDSKVGRVYDGDLAWVEICEDLRAQPEWWEELERRFELYRTLHQKGRGVPLQRVRLLDVLAWSFAAGYWDHLTGLGKALLAGTPDPDTW